MPCSCCDAIILADKSLVKHSGLENVGILSLLLRLGRSESSASEKRTLGLNTKNEVIVNDVRKFFGTSFFMKNVTKV